MIDQNILNESKTGRKLLLLSGLTAKRHMRWFRKLPQNVQDIRRIHKVYEENCENLESGIDSRWEMLSWSNDSVSLNGQTVKWLKSTLWLIDGSLIGVIYPNQGFCQSVGL